MTRNEKRMRKMSLEKLLLECDCRHEACDACIELERRADEKLTAAGYAQAVAEIVAMLRAGNIHIDASDARPPEAIHLALANHVEREFRKRGVYR